MDENVELENDMHGQRGSVVICAYCSTAESRTKGAALSADGSIFARVVRAVAGGSR